MRTPRYDAGVSAPEPTRDAPSATDEAPSSPPAVFPGATVTPRVRDGWVALGLVVALTAIYSSNRELLPGHDASGNVYLAANLLEEGRFSFSASQDPGLFIWTFGAQGAPVRVRSLDDHVAGSSVRELLAQGRLVANAPYFLTASARRDAASGEALYVNTFGPGTALAALPVLAPVRWIVGDLRRHPDALWFGAKLAASLLVAGSAAFVFLTARRWLPPGASAALALAYGLGTAVWTTSSQSLWQHGANELFVAGGVFFLSRARGSLRDAAASGAFLGAAVLCRPTSAIVALAAAAYLLAVDRRAFVALALAGAPFAAALAGYNARHLGSPLRFGQTEISRAVALYKTGSADLWQTPLLPGLAGVLASPSRGILVFSPWLALAIPGAALAWRDRRWMPLRAISAAALAILVLESCWFDWWGGWSYGYRRVVDLAPLLALLVLPVAGALAGRRLRLIAVAIAVGWSVLVQALGAVAYDVDGWNARPAYAVRLGGATVAVESPEEALALARSAGAVPSFARVRQDVDLPEHRHRLWSLRDTEIGYYLTHLGASRAAKRAASLDWLSQQPR